MRTVEQDADAIGESTFEALPVRVQEALGLSREICHLVVLLRQPTTHVSLQTQVVNSNSSDVALLCELARKAGGVGLKGTNDVDA